MKHQMHSGFAALALFTVLAGFSAEASTTSSKKCPFSPTNHPTEVTGTVDHIADGDTVSVNLKGIGKYSIRLLSIDTPELHYQVGRETLNQGPIAQVASDFMSGLVKVGDAVTVELDTEPCDTYGRVLGFIFKDGVNLNKLVLEKSMAANYCIAPNLAHCEEFGEVVAQTSQGKEGIFGVPGLQIPYLWRAEMRGTGPDKFVGDTRTKKVYQPDAVTQIPLAYRVFFLKESDVKAPYAFAE
jgi:endonuclease YncB( thermonuclease family)